MLAQMAVNDNDLSSADQHLQWVQQHAKPAVFKEIARIRHAKVLAAMDKREEALQLLEDVDDPMFKSLIHEVRGDILLQQGKTSDARRAYQQALSEGSILRESQLIEMKLANVSGGAA